MRSLFERRCDAVRDHLTQAPHASGHAICAADTYLVDRAVVGALSDALDEVDRSDLEPNGRQLWALTALGGYGRGQMCLRSDVDLQLTVPDGADPGPLMTALLDRLTRQKLKVGHGVRTTTESTMLAREEVSYATAVLGARHLAGDPAVTEGVRRSVYSHLSGSGLEHLAERLRVDRERRLDRVGDTVFVLEPDLKHGVGGLRDAQLYGWLARLTGRTVDRGVLFAEDTLLKVRTILHLHASFRCDRLSFDYQDAVAATCFDDAETEGDALQAPIRLMRDVHLAMRVIARAARLQLELVRDGLRALRREPIANHPSFVRVGDRLARASGAQPKSVPEVIAAFETVAATDLPLEAALESALEDLCNYWRSPSSDHALSDAERQHLGGMLTDLLLDPRRGASRALHALHRTGVLTEVVPQFEPIIGLVQRDLYHVFTVDEHTLRVIDKLKALARGDLRSEFPLATERFAALRARRPLMVAALLHDVGKGYGPGHHARGAELAAELGTSFGLDADDTARVQHLIRHQADMALVCTRRDLSDPHPIRSLARIVSDHETLDQLFLLTIADWSSVGPEAFHGWHRSLLATLHRRVARGLETSTIWADPSQLAERARNRLCERVLGFVPEAPNGETQALDDFMAALPTRYFTATDDDQRQLHFQLWRDAQAHPGPQLRLTDDAHPGVKQLAVVCEDRPGVLARITGALASLGLSVTAAAIHGLPADFVLDLFLLKDPHGRVDATSALATLAERIRDALDAPELPDVLRTQPTGFKRGGGLPPIATQVHGSNGVASAHSVFDVQAEDQPGLLNRIARFFFDRRLDVALAFVATEGRIARDSFYVVDGDGEPLSTVALDATTRALEEALSNAPDA